MRKRLFFKIILPVALVILVIDQATKWYVVEYLDLKTLHSLEAFPPFLNLRMAWNTGINFGIPLGGRWLLIGLTIAISVALTWWVLKRSEPMLAWGAGAVLGGAIGNAWDRVAYGAVADFINNSCCGFQNPFSYNVADVAIFAGAIWIAFKA